METTQKPVRSNARLLNFNGRTQSLTEWAKEYHIKPATIMARIERGWPTEKAITTPPGQR